MSSERDRSNGKPTRPRLPEGARILTRKPAADEVEVALELAERGASDELIRAVGGDEAVEKAHRRGR